MDNPVVIFIVVVFVIVTSGIASSIWRTVAGPKDEAFARIAPGVIPPDPYHHPVEQVRRKKYVPSPAPVRFNPPDNMQPWMDGVLEKDEVPGSAIGSMFVSLAVRGHFRIRREQDAPTTGLRRVFRRKPDWRLERAWQPPAGDVLTPSESLLIETIFPSSERYETTLSRVRYRLPNVAQTLTAQMKQDVKGRFGQPRQGKGNSAIATATLVQSKGFRTYIASAEAGQIRFEDAAGIFSRYLPWAVAFGLVDRWTQTFRDVLEAGTAAGYAGAGWDTAALGTWSSDLAWFGDIDLSSFDSALGGLDGAVGELGSFSDATSALSDAISDMSSSLSDMSSSIDSMSSDFSSAGDSGSSDSGGGDGGGGDGGGGGGD